jgi:hypothetical protein
MNCNENDRMGEIVPERCGTDWLLLQKSMCVELVTEQVGWWEDAGFLFLFGCLGKVTPCLGSGVSVRSW